MTSIMPRPKGFKFDNPTAPNTIEVRVDDMFIDYLHGFGRTVANMYEQVRQNPDRVILLKDVFGTISDLYDNLIGTLAHDSAKVLSVDTLFGKYAPPDAELVAHPEGDYIGSAE